MCDCMNKFNEQLRPHNVAVEGQSVRTWVGDEPGGVLTHRVVLKTHKIESSTKRMAPVFPTYCPFCGQPYITETV